MVRISPFTTPGRYVEWGRRATRRALLPALVWTLAVALLTLMPGKDLPNIPILGFDKLAHLGAFGLLALLYLRWLPRRRVAVVLGSALYGATLELLQGTLTADRQADPWDALANTLGSLAALGIYAVVSECKPK